MGNLGLLVREININLDQREKLIKKWKRFTSDFKKFYEYLYKIN